MVAFISHCISTISTVLVCVCECARACVRVCVCTHLSVCKHV
uniref:Uncharacterized protein n=1 Tax=Anguilla anguilla TaxID=7936 RepID=A0A0E9S3P3_ANGAN